MMIWFLFGFEFGLGWETGSTGQPQSSGSADSVQGRIYSQERGSQEPVQFIIYNAKLNRKA
ncbi:hypothetical protein HanRHA438_Chr17g0822731 [Helianthus annuus]|nr:hypothetical protein HanRHA438_Chr17g0822731 [Helianthus annuus]